MGAVIGTEEGAVESTQGNEATNEEVSKRVREEVCVSFLCTSGTRKAGPRGMRPCLKADQAPMIDRA